MPEQNTLDNRAARKQPLELQCGGCDHVWTVAYLPLEVDMIAEMFESSRCPMCFKWAKIHALIYARSKTSNEPMEVTHV